MEEKKNRKPAEDGEFDFGTGTVGEAAAFVRTDWEPEFGSRTRAEERDFGSLYAAGQGTRPRAAASYLAPGTVLEGTLRAVGDVEIAGDFKGDIITEGTVILHANIQGNLTVDSLDLSGCRLVGNIVAKNSVTVSGDSEILGDVTAKEVRCGGKVTGDLRVTGNTALEATARIDGNISTGTFSAVQGAAMKGRLETVAKES